MPGSFLDRLFAGIRSEYNKPLFVPNQVKRHPKDGNNDVEFTYDLTYSERVFITLDDFNSCIAAKVISTSIQLAVVIGTIVAIVTTIPDYRVTPASCSHPVCNNEDLCPGKMICAPEDRPAFKTTQFIIFVMLFVDYVIRVSLVPLVPPRLARILPKDFDIRSAALCKQNKEAEYPKDPKFSKYYILYKYVIKPANIVDFLAIVPSFLELFVTAGSNATVIRTLRIFRVLRILKLSRSNDTTVKVMFSALSAAAQSLFVFGMCGVVVIVLFGSVQYTLENGDFMVSEEFPSGDYLVYDPISGSFIRTPFRSILDSMYWAAVTLTTVGYGDIVPRTQEGRAFAVVLAMVGSLMIALPVTVVGHFFTQDFHDFVERKKAEELAQLERYVEQHLKAELEKKKLQRCASKAKLEFESSSGTDSKSNSDSEDSVDDDAKVLQDMVDQMQEKQRTIRFKNLVEKGSSKDLISLMAADATVDELREMYSAIESSKLDTPPVKSAPSRRGMQRTLSRRRLGSKQSLSDNSSIQSDNLIGISGQSVGNADQFMSSRSNVSARGEQPSIIPDFINTPGAYMTSGSTLPLQIPSLRLPSSSTAPEYSMAFSPAIAHGASTLSGHHSIHHHHHHHSSPSSSNSHHSHHGHHGHAHIKRRNSHDESTPLSQVAENLEEALHLTANLSIEGDTIAKSNAAANLLHAVIDACAKFDEEMKAQRVVVHKLGSVAKHALSLISTEPLASHRSNDGDEPTPTSVKDETTTPAISIRPSLSLSTGGSGDSITPNARPPTGKPKAYRNIDVMDTIQETDETSPRPSSGGALISLSGKASTEDREKNGVSFNANRSEWLTIERRKQLAEKMLTADSAELDLSKGIALKEVSCSISDSDDAGNVSNGALESKSARSDVTVSEGETSSRWNSEFSDECVFEL